jgi:hypothetical protein
MTAHRPNESVMTEHGRGVSAAFSNERRSSTGQARGGESNPALVDEVSLLARGTALEVGRGQGTDAVRPARQGRVAAVDFSSGVLLGPPVGHRIRARACVMVLSPAHEDGESLGGGLNLAGHDLRSVGKQ